MRVIVDNGGTKSDWGVVSKNNIFHFEGVSVFDSEDVIINTFKKNISKISQSVNVTDLDFYTAGSNEVIKDKMRRIFSSYFPLIKFSIYSDMLCASRALFFNQPGVSCILGTGSNCAYYDGVNNHTITPSLGYLFSDEGSGYDLGKRLLFNYFNNIFSMEIDQVIFNETNMTKDNLLSDIYSSNNPKKYISSFSFLIKKYMDHLEIQDLINSSLLGFLSNHPFQYKGYHNLQFGFVGSIAFVFKKNISHILNKEKINHIIIEKPILNLLSYYES